MVALPSAGPAYPRARHASCCAAQARDTSSNREREHGTAGSSADGPWMRSVPGSCGASWLPRNAAIYGAGEGNRTLVSSLGSYSSTIELRPRRRVTVYSGSGPQRNGGARAYPWSAALEPADDGSALPGEAVTTNGRHPPPSFNHPPIPSIIHRRPSADQKLPLKLAKIEVSIAFFCIVLALRPMLLCSPNSSMRAPNTAVA